MTTSNSFHRPRRILGLASMGLLILCAVPFVVGAGEGESLPSVVYRGYSLPENQYPIYIWPREQYVTSSLDEAAHFAVQPGGPAPTGGTPVVVRYQSLPADAYIPETFDPAYRNMFLGDSRYVVRSGIDLGPYAQSLSPDELTIAGRSLPVQPSAPLRTIQPVTSESMLAAVGSDAFLGELTLVGFLALESMSLYGQYDAQHAAMQQAAVRENALNSQRYNNEVNHLDDYRETFGDDFSPQRSRPISEENLTFYQWLMMQISHSGWPG